MADTRRRGLRAVVTACALVLIGGLVAHALWSATRQSLDPTMQVGAVHFSAQVGNDVSTRQVSQAGEAVSLTLPGSQIIRVLDQPGPDPDPVFWRFQLTGAAMGITGMIADIQVTEQVDPDDTRTDLTGGIAPDDTVLGNSVIKVYPAAAGGDCSVVPATPAGQEDRNVLVYDGEDYLVQGAGLNHTGDLITRWWCVAMDWIDDADAEYVNEVQVIGTGQDGSASSDLDEWRGVVAFPRTLDPIGNYTNQAWVEAIGVDGTVSRDDDSWTAVLYPDPSNEPDVVLTFDPSITNLNPNVATGDQPVFTTP